MFQTIIILSEACSQYYWLWDDISAEKPKCKEVFCINDILYAYSLHKVFYSTDAGNSWFLYKDFIPDVVQEIAISNDNKVFVYHYNSLPAAMSVGTIWTGIYNTYTCNGLTTYCKNLTILDSLMFVSSGEKVFRSDDYGANWVNSSNGLPSGYSAYCLNNAKIYTLYSNNSQIFAGTNCFGIYRSFDFGLSWDSINSGIPMQTRTRVNFIISNQERMFASTTKGLFYSDNIGQSWIKHDDLPVFLPGAPIHLSGENIIYLVYDSLFISNNNGLNWDVVHYNDPFAMFITNHIIAADNYHFYLLNSNFYYGTDKYGFFEQVRLPSSYGLSHNHALFLLKKDMHLFSSTENGGIYVSNDLAKTWLWHSDYLAGTIVYSMLDLDSLLVAATNKGIYLSQDLGSMWYWNDTAVHTSTCGNLVNFMNKVYCTVDDKVYAISDDLMTGEWYNNGINGLEVNYLLASDGMFYACTSEGVYTLDMINEIWVQLSAAPVGNISTLAAKNDMICLAINNSINYSYDNGNNWQIHQLDECDKVHYLTYLEDIILAGTNKGIIKFYNSNWYNSFFDADTRHILVDDSVTYASSSFGVYRAINTDIISNIESIKIDQLEISPNPVSENLYFSPATGLSMIFRGARNPFTL